MLDNWQAIGDVAQRVLMSHPQFGTAKVCSICALGAGGRFPTGHYPAFTFDTCILCMSKKRVTETANWSWIEQ